LPAPAVAAGNWTKHWQKPKSCSTPPPNVGYSPQCGKKLLGGWHAEVGVGYKGKTDLINGIKIEVGYNFRALRLTRDGKKLDPTCHALSVGIGFVF